MSVRERVEQISRRRPDCGPWLTLLGEAFTAAADDAWARMVRDVPDSLDGHHESGVPLLANAIVRVDADVVRRHVERLATTATAVTDSRQCGASRRRGTGAPEPQALAVLRAAIANDLEAIDEAAADAGIERDVARVIAPLAAMPLLLAHARTWSGRVSPTWMHPWCPVCGAWPGLAEVRGLDRTRRFRCLRCAADWHAEWLACPYCGNREHTQLGALVSADSPETRKAETCKRCLGYIKSVTTLAPSDPLELAIVDVDTVELDIAALEHGYQRPERPAHGLGMRLEPRPARRLFRWWS